MDAHFDSLALEIGIRVIDRLVAKGTLTEADAAEVYARILVTISDPEGRAAILRILEANDARGRPK